MEKSKLVKANEKIAEKVVDTYKKSKIRWSVVIPKSKIQLFAVMPKSRMLLWTVIS